MTAGYAEDRASVLEAIRDAGAPVVFLANAWQGGAIASDTTGSAVEIPGDPDVYQSLSLIERNPVTLLVAAKDLGITPAPGAPFRWASVDYTVRLATPLAPDGSPILWTLIGSS